MSSLASPAKYASIIHNIRRYAEKLIEDCRDENDWGRVKLLLAEAIAKTIGEFLKSIRRIYFLDLSGGELATGPEGGTDIDIYIETADSSDEAYIRVLEESIDSTLLEVFRKSSHHNCPPGASRIHNIIEFHVNSEFLKPIIDNNSGRPRYARPLFTRQS